MRICFVGPANSVHIVKWCIWFSTHGHEVHVISFTDGKIDNAEIHVIDIRVDTEGSDLGKLKYMATGKQIKKIVYKIQPDIVNAHYASSYGVAMALSGIDNYILSVWGSDIYDFPKKSIFHKNLLKYSLKKARYLFSTSKAMAKEASKYTDKKFEITPFGVDMELFNPNKRTRPKIDAPFVLGIVKSLDDKYGIDYILKAASIIRKNNPEIDISVRIAGEGPKADEYQNLAIKLGIENCTSFLGLISQQEAAIEWANMDIAILPSILYESFGVAAVEAEASGTSIIISDVPGLMETTIPGQSSEMVPKKDAGAIADAILKLYYHPEMRQQMGEIGRQYVTEKYELNKCFADIEKYFEIWRGGGIKR